MAVSSLRYACIFKTYDNLVLGLALFANVQASSLPLPLRGGRGQGLGLTGRIINTYAAITAEGVIRKSFFLAFFCCPSHLSSFLKHPVNKNHQ